MPSSDTATSGRGRPPRLTVEQVVAAATDLVDESGLDALSMAGVASRLGVGTMTLYTYVEGKEDLLDRMAVGLFADLEIPDVDGLGRLAAYLGSFRRVALGHPALARLLAGGRITIPDVFDHLESLLTALAADGFESRDAVRAIFAGLSYTIGFVLWEIPRSVEQSPEEYATQWRDLIARLDPAEYPMLSGDAATDLPTVADDIQFDWGLQALLEGIAANAAA